MVQWHTQKNITTKKNTPKTNYRCKPAIYKTFQPISDTFIAPKTPKTAKKHLIFASKNAKNASFLLILHQKTRKNTTF